MLLVEYQDHSEKPSADLKVVGGQADVGSTTYLTQAGFSAVDTS